MRIHFWLPIVASIALPSLSLFAQSGKAPSGAAAHTHTYRVPAKGAHYYHQSDSSQIQWTDSIPANNEKAGLEIRRSCKSYLFLYPVYPNSSTTLSKPLPPIAVANTHVPLLQVKGNILYDVNYRSRIDTPYAENNVYQHTLQTRLDFLYKGQYPFKIYLTTHFGNSNLFRKYTDLNFRYLSNDFTRIAKQRVLNAVEGYFLSHYKQLDSLKRLIDSKKAMISSLSHSIGNEDMTQKLVEDRERKLYDQKNKQSPTAGLTELPSKQTALTSLGAMVFKFHRTNTDSSDSAGKTNRMDTLSRKYTAYKDSLENKKKKLDSLVADVQRLEGIYNNLQGMRQLNKDQVVKSIQGSNDAGFLKKKMGELQLPDTLLPKGYKTLFAVKSFDIGRTMVNYSELSVKDISVTGLQAEYSPHLYYAFAAGKVDYRFRDYIVPARTSNNQYVAVARFGKGMRNGNHVIFTYYTGKRQFFNSSVALQPGNNIPSYNLAGITLEASYRINRNVNVTGEVAKSTIPYYSLDSLQRKKWMNSVTSIHDRSNEAYAVKVYSFFPKTQTRITGDLKYIGANFQSFSTFTTGASQTQWQARLQQPFFKKVLTVTSALQQNDYYNPFVTTTYKSSAIMASLQADVRLKKWPYLSMGYYPSYQLTKINDNNYEENRYYTFMASSGYYYRIHAVQFSSYVVYSQFYNAPNDSGFVYFNSKNYLASQTAYVKRFSFQLEGSLSENVGYNIYTIENNDQFSLTKMLSVGGGWKLIRQTLFDDLLWGYSGNIGLTIPKLGNIQLRMDKGFIPSIDKRLVPNNYGRLTYFKTF